MFEYTMCVYLENTFSKTFALMSDLFSIFWVSLFWKLPGSPFEWPIHYFIFKILWIQMTIYLYLSTRNRFSTPKYGIKHVSHLCILIWKKWDIAKNANWRPSWIDVMVSKMETTWPIGEILSVLCIVFHCC